MMTAGTALEFAVWLIYIRHMATTFSLESFVKAPPLRQAEAVARGLPVKAVRDLVADPAVTIADVARIVGPRRTLDRRLKEDERLTPE
ncbi:MAG: antitoxin Xre-like helix-turn-helix domain-containing protein, partial [Sphingomonadaceae bacterium]